MKKVSLALLTLAVVLISSCSSTEEGKVCSKDSTCCDSTKVDTSIVKAVETSTVTVDSTK